MYSLRKLKPSRFMKICGKKQNILTTLFSNPTLFNSRLGDFAVLLNAGMTVRQAMVYNFLSACTCYLGLFLGIMVGEMHMGNQYIFAAAGGMFLYIALVDMVPEMNATMDQMSKIGVKNAMLVFLLQNIGILSGIVSLFVLAKFQDDIHIEL